MSKYVENTYSTEEQKSKLNGKWEEKMALLQSYRDHGDIDNIKSMRDWAIQKSHKQKANARRQLDTLNWLRDTRGLETLADYELYLNNQVIYCDYVDAVKKETKRHLHNDKSHTMRKIKKFERQTFEECVTPDPERVAQYAEALQRMLDRYYADRDSIDAKIDDIQHKLDSLSREEEDIAV